MPVGIMACTDGIYIVLLHQPQIRFHLLHVYGKACNWITVMAVYTMEFYGCFIDKQHSIVHINLPDAEAVGDPFLFGLKLNGVKPGRLCIPKPAVFQTKTNPVFLCFSAPVLL